MKQRRKGTGGSKEEEIEKRIEEEGGEDKERGRGREVGGEGNRED